MIQSNSDNPDQDHDQRGKKYENKENRIKKQTNQTADILPRMRGKTGARTEDFHTLIIGFTRQSRQPALGQDLCIFVVK